MKRTIVTAVTTAVAFLLSGCTGISLPTSMVGASAIGSNRAAITIPGSLPPPPERIWVKDEVDVNEHRADGWGLVSMPEMDAYLNDLLRKIKVTTGTSDWPGRVYITAESALTAGSSPAGNIYISLGWLQSAESEDEIYAILSHEYGHIYLNHYSAYSIGNLGDTSLLLSSLGWSYANRKKADTGWNGVDKIQVIQLVGTSILMPAWDRSLEEQADLFGATVSLKCGYSYIHGFKAFLERIDSYDRRARAEHDDLQKAKERVAREAIRKQTLTKIASSQSTTSTTPPTSQSKTLGLASLNNALAQLNAALMEGQVKLNQGTFDIGQSITTTVQATYVQISETHPEGALREDYLSKQFANLIKRNRPPARVQEWDAIRKRVQTAEVLSHYVMTWRAVDLLVAGDKHGALKLAKQAASGKTANDASMVRTLASVVDETGSANQSAVTDILLRNLKAPERSWRVQVDVANRLSMTNRAKARVFLDQQFQYFGKAPKLWPDVIAFYQRIGDDQLSKQMALACAAASPDYRNACVTASQSAAELTQSKAKADAHVTIVTDQVKKKWFK